MTSLRHRKLLILGSGRTAASILAWGIHQGATCRLMDQQETPQRQALCSTYPGLTYHIGPWHQPWFDWAEVIGISPGIPFFDVPASVRHKIVSDIELFSWNPPCCPIIGVTGSNGKTTTTEMIAHLSRQRYDHVILCGNNNTTILDMSHRQDPTVDLYVLELSSFQLFWTRTLRCQQAAILNISSDHLNWHQEQSHYIASKWQLAHCCEHLVLNADDPILRSHTPTVSSTYFGYADDTSPHPDVYAISYPDRIIICHQDQQILSLPHTYTKPQISNILATIALCMPYGYSSADYETALASFDWPAHRLQAVHQGHGIIFYDDSKATNIGATEAALAGLPDGISLILGGQDKGQEFAPFLRDGLSKVVFISLLGEATNVLLPLLAIYQPSLDVRCCDTLAEAVYHAADAAVQKSAGTVLLSPACASQDMFDDYADRGRQFTAAVAHWLQQNTVC